MSIVTKAQTRNKSSEGYKERHHIIPRGMGGTNDATNLVDLAAREHFVCHLLLRKMVEGVNKRKAWMALQAMTMQAPWQIREYKITARLFEDLRSKMPPESDETRQKKRQSAMGRKHSEETKKKMSETRARVFRENTDYKQACLAALAKGNKDRKVSSETRAKIAKAGKERIDNVWILTSPSGEIYKTHRLLEFCKAYELQYGALQQSLKSGYPAPPEQKTGRRFKSDRRNTIGWKLDREKP